MAKVLIACEFSGVVREAFRELGHDAWSCDLLDTEISSPYHIQGDVLPVIKDDYWDLMIAHPPCTHLAVSGARYFKFKQQQQEEALEFVRQLLLAPIPRIALENPIGIISSRIRKPDQIIQPWQFGHDASKATCLWLKNLPPLIPTKMIQPKYACSCGLRYSITLTKCPDCKIPAKKKVYANQTSSGQNKLGPSPTRAQERSKTYEGIGTAMAWQWGDNMKEASNVI